MAKTVKVLNVYVLNDVPEFTEYVTYGALIVANYPESDVAVEYASRVADIARKTVDTDKAVVVTFHEGSVVIIELDMLNDGRFYKAIDTTSYDGANLVTIEEVLVGEEN